MHLSRFGVCCGSLGESLRVCSRARRSSFSFSWILACLLPQRKKKKGHVCLEKYVGQWNISCTGAKGVEGSGGGEGEAERSSEGTLLAIAPHPTCFCLGLGGQLAGSFPSLTHFPDRLCSPWKQHRLFLPSRRCGPPRNSARQLSPPTPVSQLPPPSPPRRHRSLRNRSGPSAETCPVSGLCLRAQTCPARTAWRGRQSCARPPLAPSHGTAGWQRAR